MPGVGAQKPAQCSGLIGVLPDGHFRGNYGTSLFLRCSRDRRETSQQQCERDRADLGGPARLDGPSD
eukprot:13145842-Heterocapsa_arctica.AAC.1